MITGWAEEVANHLWELAGTSSPCPDRLEEAALWALPLAIVYVNGLTVRSVYRYLTRCGVPAEASFRNRLLRGCLVAYGGKGITFLNADDPADERRFSLAHEIAHFLVDYLEPRRTLVAALGPGLADVLDGLRKASQEERIDALIVGLPIGAYTHFMASGEPFGGQVEPRADRLALEILAPRVEVERRLTLRQQRSGRCAVDLVMMLVEDFGLPEGVARVYAGLLRTMHNASFRDWLGVTSDYRRGGCRTFGSASECDSRKHREE